MTKFKSVLIEKGLTGKQFAAMCGLSRSIIYKYMSNDRKLSQKTASKFAAILCVTEDELIGVAEASKHKQAAQG